jgi:Na+-driven multidrug efflux pump
MGTTLTSILKAVGRPARVLQMMAIGVALNLVLTPLFIFAFRWGMKGAGGATLLVTILSAGIIIPHFTSRKSPLPIRGLMLRLDGKALLRIVDIGLAPFMITVVTSVIVFFTNRGLIVWGGVGPQEGYLIASRYHYLFAMIFVGVSQGIQPIIGYNFGAGNVGRMFGTLDYAFRVVAGAGVIALAAGCFAAGPLAGIFRPGAELADEASKALAVLTITMPLTGCQIIMSGFFQHIGIALRSALLSIARLVAFIPLVLLLPLWRGVDGVWLSLPLSEVAVFVVTAIVFGLQRRRMTASIANP